MAEDELLLSDSYFINESGRKIFTMSEKDENINLAKIMLTVFLGNRS
jgi:hypothetical protein